MQLFLLERFRILEYGVYKYCFKKCQKEMLAVCLVVIAIVVFETCKLNLLEGRLGSTLKYFKPQMSHLTVIASPQLQF